MFPLPNHVPWGPFATIIYGHLELLEVIELQKCRLKKYNLRVLEKWLSYWTKWDGAECTLSYVEIRCDVWVTSNYSTMTLHDFPYLRVTCDEWRSKWFPSNLILFYKGYDFDVCWRVTFKWFFNLSQSVSRPLRFFPDVKYCFTSPNRFTAAVGLRDMPRW